MSLPKNWRRLSSSAGIPKGEPVKKVDQNIGQKDFLWFRYSGLLQNYAASGGRQSLLRNEEHRAKNIGVSSVHTFGPSSVLQAQYGRVVMRDDSHNRFAGLPATFGEQIGFSDQFAGNYKDVSTLTPAMVVPDYFSGGELDQLFRPSDIHEAKADYSRIHGNHTLKMGGNFDSNSVRIQNRFPTMSRRIWETPAAPWLPFC
jgi:hypothetical protein